MLNSTSLPLVSVAVTRAIVKLTFSSKITFSRSLLETGISSTASGLP